MAVVGEIYVRCDPFTNDFVIDRLEKRGIRVKFAPFNEFIEYVDWVNTVKLSEGRHEQPGSRLAEHLTLTIKRLVIERLYDTVRPALGWSGRLRVTDTMEAVEPYLTPDLHGEAVLTLGGPIHEYEQGEIIGVVNVGPLECMPTKIAEAQFYHVAEENGIIPLCLSVNGEPVDPELLDNFAYEIHTRFVRDEETLLEAQATSRRELVHEPARRGVNGSSPMAIISRLLRSFLNRNGRSTRRAQEKRILRTECNEGCQSGSCSEERSREAENPHDQH